MRRIAQQEATAVAEAYGPAVMDAVGGEPGAGLDRQCVAGFVAQGGDDGVEFQVRFVAQGLRQNAGDAPVVFPAHREQEMEAVSKEVDVDLVGNHGAGHLGIGDEEDMLIRGAGKLDAARFAHGAAGAIAPGNPGSADTSLGTVGLLEHRGDGVGLLRESDEFGAPLDGRSQFAKVVAHQAFVVVLSEDEEVGVRSYFVAGVGESDARAPLPVGPDVAAGAALA